MERFFLIKNTLNSKRGTQFRFDVVQEEKVRNDPIVEEVKEAGSKLALKCDNDLHI